MDSTKENVAEAAAAAEKIGGDMDDYVTATYKIPSFTSEIGYMDQFL